MNKFIVAIFSPFILMASATAQAGEDLRVVATQSTFASLVKEIGGSDVSVSYVASPKFNVHFIEPKPSDVLKLKRADLFVHGGLDLELWREPLVDAAGNMRIKSGGSGELDLSQGVRLLGIPRGTLTRAAGDIHIYGNPHYWFDPENIKIMVTAVARKLSDIKPDRMDEYKERLARFVARLEERTHHWKGISREILSKEIVAYHNSWPYLAEFAGVKLEKFLEPKSGIPPTPKHIKMLERYMEERNISVIVQSTFYGRGPADSLAKRTDAQVVFLCQNVGEIPECTDYISLMDYNIAHLVEALSGEGR
jgi:zinc/manganese transport system substrate-binding protein